MKILTFLKKLIHPRQASASVHKNCKDNIGQPVIAIAKSIRDNPTHWKLLADPYNQSKDGYGFEWILKDIKRNRYFQCYEIVRYNRYAPSGSREEYSYHSSVEKWATKDEVEYIVAEVKKMMDKKEARLERYKKYKLNKPRKLLMEIYCAKES